MHKFSHSMLPTAEQTAIIHNRLKRSGWSVGDFAAFSSTDPPGVAYVVSGLNGENVLRVEGET